MKVLVCSVMRSRPWSVDNWPGGQALGTKRFNPGVLSDFNVSYSAALSNAFMTVQHMEIFQVQI